MKTAAAADAVPGSGRRDFADGARAGFNAARRATGEGPAVAFRVGDRVLLLRFAGPALVAALTRALALEQVSAETSADLEVGVWDQESTGIGPPPCPFGAGDFLVRGDVRHAWGEGIHLTYAVVSETLEYADLRARAGCFWIRRPDGLDHWRVAAPLRGLLSVLAASGGSCLAHAAAVGRKGEGLLLAGPGGSGKSTTALAAAARGWSFCGDDFVLVRRGAGGAHVDALYGTAKLTPAGTRAAGLAPDHFPRLVNPTGGPGDKTIFQVRSSPRLRLRAIVVPSVAGGERPGGALRPASRAEVVRALLPSSLLLVPGATPEVRARLIALATELPGFILQLGPDPEDNVGALARALEAAGPFSE